MKTTHGRLADGREIIYYDERDDAVRQLVDRRDLPPARPWSTVRYDPVLDEWVTLAGHRQNRTYLPPSEECPLCPSRPNYLSEIPSPEYDVVVFENRFPSFVSPVEPHSWPVARPFTEAPAAGRCEVICFTADHCSSFSKLSTERVGTIIDAWIDRTEALGALPFVEQVFCFENRGQEIGVTLHHPHGQIYGYPFVTPRTRRMLESARRYREDNGRSLFADLLQAEVEHGERIIVRSDQWTALVPFASRWPLEIHLYPNRQVPTLADLTSDERAELAVIYPDLLRRMEAVHDETVAYIAAWHQAPVREGQEDAYLHLELMSNRRAPGKLKYLAGSESAMDAFVNDVSPERIAGLLRSRSPLEA